MSNVGLTLKHRAVDHIVHKLLSGELPAGERVSELALARDMHISRGPVREALNQLASRGWVDMVPGMGAYARMPDKRELMETYGCREALECHAVDEACGKMSLRQVRRLQKSGRLMKRVIDRVVAEGMSEFDERAAIDWFEADILLHGTILKAAGNRQVIRAMSDMHLMVRAWGQQPNFTRFPIVKLLTLNWREHRKIASAMAAGNKRRARYWMRRHIRRTGRRYLWQYSPEQAEKRPLGARLIQKVMDYEAELLRSIL